MVDIEKVTETKWRIPKHGKMLVDGFVYASEPMMEDIRQDESLQQVANVAQLPGILGGSLAMPDIHWGYGFPIGGVAAMDAEEGVVSPGGVGYDINCGVRLAVAPIPFKDLDERVRRALLEHIFHLVPSGVGHGHKG